MSNSFRHKTSDERIAYTFSQIPTRPSSPVSKLSPYRRKLQALYQVSNSRRSKDRVVSGRPLLPSTKSSVRCPSPLFGSILFSSDADISGDVGLGSSLLHEYSTGPVARVPSRALPYQGGPIGGMTTLNIAERYRITPEEGILLYPHQREDDDELHQPDDEKEARSWNICTRRGLVQVGSLMAIMFGLLTLFIGYPIM